MPTQGNYTKYLIREIAPVLKRQINSHCNSKVCPPTRPYSFYTFESLTKDWHIVARKTKRAGFSATSAGSKPNALPVTWRNYKLTSDDIPVVLADTEDEAELSSRVAALWTSGADFSVKFNPDRGNWSAFSIEAPREDISERTGISAFGANQWQAIAALLYKIELYVNHPDRFASSGASLGIG